MIRRFLLRLAVPALALGTLLTLTSISQAGVFIGFGSGYYGRGFGVGFGNPYPFYGGSLYSGIMPPPYWGAGYYSPRDYQPYYDNYQPSYYAQPAYYAPQPAPLQLTDSDVLFNVRVPRNATVWVNGDKTTQSGEQREFMSSDLTPGKTYTYVLKAQWMEGGKPVTATRRVKVQGGERRTVDLLTSDPRPVPPGPEGA